MAICIRAITYSTDVDVLRHKHIFYLCFATCPGLPVCLYMQTDRHIDRQTDGWNDIQTWETDERTDTTGCKEVCLYVCPWSVSVLDGQTYRQMDRKTSLDVRTGRQIYVRGRASRKTSRWTDGHRRINGLSVWLFAQYLFYLYVCPLVWFHPSAMSIGRF